MNIATEIIIPAVAKAAIKAQKLMPSNSAELLAERGARKSRAAR